MRLTVRVHPNARADLVGGCYGTAEPPVLEIWVRARAQDGAANRAVLDVLAPALGVRRQDLSIVTGGRSRTKVVQAEGADPGVLRRLLESPPGRQPSP